MAWLLGYRYSLKKNFPFQEDTTIAVNAFYNRISVKN
jgi:hypothetical protein